jgi:prepilin-type N-terminal cleavage/methylation domain-containing protein
MKNGSDFLQNGYSLIELLLVVAVIGILSSLGFSTFISYSQNQSLINATNELYSGISQAKSRTQTQVKPSAESCLTDTFDGYTVRIYSAPNNNCSSESSSCYVITASCGSVEITSSEIRKSVPSNITIDSDSAFRFNVLTGEVRVLNPQTNEFTDLPPSSGVRVGISSGDRERSIIINQDGRITLN